MSGWAPFERIPPRVTTRFAGFPRFTLACTWKDDNTADDEQRQIISLLQELQLAMESPSLLTVPPEGTVLHLGAAEKEVGAAVSHLCVALEKCLFFGAEGSMPDFWWVLDRASEGDAASSAAAAAASSGVGGGGGGFEGLNLDGKGKDVDDGSGVRDGAGGSDIRATKSPEPLAASIYRLTRVHTGHARCRAWARGLLGMDGASAEGELRKAAASVVHLSATRVTIDESAPCTETGDNQFEKADNAAGTALSSAQGGKVDARAGESDPDAGGGVGRSVGTKSPAAASATATATAAAAGPVDLPTNELGHDRPFSPPPSMPPPSSSLLPLWLRSNAKGSSILDDVCRSLVAFSRQLDERGLSVRPSLDHAWLDHESLAAVTTYTWPSFSRARLRCYVRGAGIPAANGEYSPAATGEEGEGGTKYGGAMRDRGLTLTLVGPNDCKICRKACATSAGQKAALSAAVLGDPAADLLEEPAAENTSGCAATKEETGAAAQDIASFQEDDHSAPTALVPEAPVAQLWHLLVPEAGSSGPGAPTRSAYFCLGDGPLPPSRGWRSTDGADAPAPVLRFGTQADDDDSSLVGGARSGRGGGGEDHQQAQATGEEGWSDDTAVFRAALPPADVGVVATEGASALGAVVAAAGVPSADTEAIRGSSTPTGKAEAARRGRLNRRRKRRRPAEGIEDAASAVGRESLTCGELTIPKGRQAKGILVENESVSAESGCVAEACGGGAGCGGKGPAGSDSNASADDDRVAGCEGGDEAVAAFKAERWRLPEPSGELLSRVEESRELLRRTIEVLLGFR